jgi:hypothetical protein
MTYHSACFDHCCGREAYPSQGMTPVNQFRVLEGRDELTIHAFPLSFHQLGLEEGRTKSLKGYIT